MTQITTPADNQITAVTERLAHKQQAILERLSSLGVEKLTIELSGRSDESDIESIVASPHDLDFSVVPLNPEDPQSRFTFEDELEGFAYDLMEHIYPRFYETPEGTKGLIAFDVASQTMTLNADLYYETQRASERVVGPLSALKSYFASTPAFKNDKEPRFASWRRDPEEFFAVMKRLQESDIAKIHVDYQGYSDEGHEFTVIALDEAGNEIQDLAGIDLTGLLWTSYQPLYGKSSKWYEAQGYELVSDGDKSWLKLSQEVRSFDVRQFLEEAMSEMVNALDAGYENNDGGGGDAHINVKDMSISFNSYRNGTEAETVVTHFGAPFSAVQRPATSQRNRG